MLSLSMMNGVFLSAVMVVSSAVLGVFLVQLAISLRRYQISSGEVEAIASLGDTPSVSLCIPARNETHALADCLTSALASDYPKLEIIVLDDCSQDKTSQVIRGYAHDGVRFIQGESPSDGWLGKNNAYSALASEAKGSILVFMSVDTIVSEHSISQLVAYMRLKKLSMVSVLPQKSEGFRARVLFSPLRYFWQVVLPLKFTTPVATSIWAVARDELDEAGGIALYKEKVDIENKLADLFQAQDTYRFLIANQYLRINYLKSWHSQVETSLRLWYPTLGKSVLNTLAVCLVHIFLFIVPPVAMVFGILSFYLESSYIQSYWVLAGFASLIASYIYVTYMRQIKALESLDDWLVVVLSFFMIPFVAFQEVVLIIASFVAYKRGRVEWKGRNVCFPTSRRF